MKKGVKYTYDEYAEDILSGRIKSCECIFLACKRYREWFDRDDIYFDREDVEQKIRVISRMKHSTGVHNGKPFILLPWQQWCVANIFGWKYKDSGLRVTKNVFMMLSRKSGKQLSLDTPIITPNGYTTMGEIKVGDTIFDEEGKETRVLDVTPIDNNPISYEIEFSDGEKIKACKDHNWYVDRNHKNQWHVETTQEIIDKGYIRTRKDKYTECYVCVPLPKPLQMQEREVPIDPYTLGAWLGDGSKSGAILSLNGDDMEEIKSYIPYTPTVCKRMGDENCFIVRYGYSEFSKSLIELGLKDNKHIPHDYLFNSYENRLALLQGLMDTDGYVTDRGGSIQCEIIQKRKSIADGIGFLLSSFGIKYHCSEKMSKIYGKEYGNVYRITFSVDNSIPIFRLKRKYDLLPNTKRKRNVKYIRKITPIESIPMRCITVDSPNHLYLCGERNTVTHNTAFASAIAICCAIADKEANAEVELVANSRQQAHIAFDSAHNLVDSIDPKKKIFKRYRDSLNIPSSKSKIQVLSSDAMGNDGYNSSCFILDEFHAAKTWDLYNVMKSSQGMRTQPLAIIITTAGFLLNGYPCYEHRLMCMEILKGNKMDDSQFSAIYELEDEDDWEDESTWVKCSPSIGQTVSYSYMKDQLQAAKNNPALEVGVRTKNFNQFCQSKDVWISDRYLMDAFGKVDLERLKDEECYMGVDLSAISDLTAVSIVFPPNEDREYLKDKFIFTNRIYIPSAAIEESVNTDIYKQWKRQGYAKVTSGNVVDYDYILKDQLEDYNKYYLRKVAYDSWNSTQWAINATTEGLPLYPFSQALGNFNRPTKAFEMLIKQGKVVIANNPAVRWCFNNVEIKADHNDNQKPTKAAGDPNRKIDPIIAMIQALGGYLDTYKRGIGDGEVLSV